MNKLITVLLLTVATATFAADTDWVDITNSDTAIYAIKKKSVTISQTAGGTPVVVAVGRSKEIPSNKLRVFQMYVPVDACVAGGGTFVITDMAGVVTSKTDFVYGLGSIAAEVAQIMCEIIKSEKPTPPSSPAPRRADNLKTT